MAAANKALSAQVEADLARFWRRIDLSKPDVATNALLNYVPLLVQRYGEVAATLAADWFELLRLEAVDAGVIAAVGRATSFKAVAADPVAVAVAERAVRSASGYLWTPEPERTLTAVTGTARRQVLQAGRDTITLNTGRDRSARGWQRFVSSGGCKFCQMLSGRGGVYTERTSRFAAHDDCNCTAAPVWDPSAPKVDVAAEFVASPRWGALRDAAAKGDTQAAEELESYRAQVRAYLARQPDGAGMVYHRED